MFFETVFGVALAAGVEARLEVRLEVRLERARVKLSKQTATGRIS